MNFGGSVNSYCAAAHTNFGPVYGMSVSYAARAAKREEEITTGNKRNGQVGGEGEAYMSKPAGLFLKIEFRRGCPEAGISSKTGGKAGASWNTGGKTGPWAVLKPKCAEQPGRPAL